MMQRSTDYHHILDIRKPIKVIRELVPDHRQSDSAAQACPGGTLSIFWNVEPWDCLAEWQPAATFTSQKTQKDREQNLNRPPPRNVYTAENTRNAQIQKNSHTINLLVTFPDTTVSWVGPGRIHFVATPLHLDCGEILLYYHLAKYIIYMLIAPLLLDL